MLNARAARIVFHIVDVLGGIALAAGALLIVLYFVDPRGAGPDYFFFGLIFAVSGFSCFITAHIGRALVDTAEAAKAILAKLSKG